MKNKNLDEIWFQYKRALKTAFPKIRFKQSTWNWRELYPNEDPYKNTRFLLIYHAYQNTLRRHGIKKDGINGSYNDYFSVCGQWQGKCAFVLAEGLQMAKKCTFIVCYCVTNKRLN